MSPCRFLSHQGWHTSSHSDTPDPSASAKPAGITGIYGNVGPNFAVWHEPCYHGTWGQEIRTGMRQAWKRSSGFTLIELMIVVVIVGVLSVLAVTGYRRYTFAARNAEAQSFLLAVKGAQQTYFQAFGEYCGTLQPQAWPAEIPFEAKANWNNAPAGSAWAALGIKSPGRVWFQYVLVAGTPGDALGTCSQSLPNNTKHWFCARAHGNFDGTRGISTFEISSHRSDVWRAHENE